MKVKNVKISIENNKVYIEKSGSYSKNIYKGTYKEKIFQDYESMEYLRNSIQENYIINDYKEDSSDLGDRQWFNEPSYSVEKETEKEKPKMEIVGFIKSFAKIMSSFYKTVNELIKKTSKKNLNAISGQDWFGKNDYVSLTKEEANYQYNKHDEVFVEALRINLNTAKNMFENGYKIPSKIKKALLNEFLMNSERIDNDTIYDYFKNEIFKNRKDYKNKKFIDFYLESKIVDDTLLEAILIKKNKYNYIDELVREKVANNMDYLNYEEMGLFQAINQLIEKKVIEPAYFVEKYNKKEISLHLLAVLIVKYSNEIAPHCNSEILNGFSNLCEYNRYEKRSDYGVLINEKLRKILIKENERRANNIINELKDETLNNAIVEDNYKLIGKEFKNDGVDYLLNKFENIVNKLSSQNITEDEEHNKNLIVKNLNTILINHLSLKDLQNDEFSFKDLTEQVTICIDELSNMYKEAVERDLKSLNNDLKIRKRTI